LTSRRLRSHHRTSSLTSPDVFTHINGCFGHFPRRKKIHREEHHKGKVAIPDTKVGEEGSAKRNIQRKNDHDPHRKDKPQNGGGGGKGKWNELDDGTYDTEE
jgi:hypothetical protein